MNVSYSFLSKMNRRAEKTILWNLCVGRLKGLTMSFWCGLYILSNFELFYSTFDMELKG